MVPYTCAVTNGTVTREKTKKETVHAGVQANLKTSRVTTHKSHKLS
jgi:hypothetical protein